MIKQEIIPQLKTISEVANVVGLAKYHVRQLVLKQKIKYIKSGCKYLINVQSLIDYLNKGENKENDKMENLKIRKVV